MGRRSTIKRLPPEIREQIGRLHKAGYTNAQIVAQLKALGAVVSVSATQRYTKEIKVLGERLQRSRIVAEGLIAKFGNAPEGKALRLNVELAHEVMLRLLAGEGGAQVTLTPKDAMFVAGALGNLARASKTDADLHAQVKKATLEQAATKVKQQGAAKGLSPQVIAKIETLLKGI